MDERLKNLLRELFELLTTDPNMERLIGTRTHERMHSLFYDIHAAIVRAEALEPAHLTDAQARAAVLEVRDILYLDQDGELDPELECNGGDAVQALTDWAARYGLVPPAPPCEHEFATATTTYEDGAVHVFLECDECHKTTTTTVGSASLTWND